MRHMPGKDNERIAKNTIFLYGRMMLIMLVTLYTSRVTLQVLGIDDYGIYQTVGGVVTFLAFISNALGSGTSRFITYEMGKEKPQLSQLFATVRMAHIVIAASIVVVGEIVGMWFIHHKLIIPIDRLEAAIFAFHLSMLTTFFQITQVPYNSMIVAYERMNVYAYVSIIEAVSKLSIVYLLQIFWGDKLEVYAVLMAIVTVLIMMMYRVYCRRKFVEARGRLAFDREMFRSIATFSGWSLLSSSAASFANQGVTIVTNMFFSPSVVTVRSLALRVNNVINQFIGNFRTAVNPQIVKLYAAKEYDRSKKLALASTKYTYFLMLLIVLPLYLLVEPALKIWLGDIPDGTIPFVKLALIQGLFQSLDISLYVPIYAKGQIKENAIISPLCDFIQLPVVYVLFKLGHAPIALAWVEACACVVLGVVLKPILVHRIVKYDLKEVYSIILQCFSITAAAAIIPFLISVTVNVNTVVGFLLILTISLISVAALVWFFGIDRNVRAMLVLWFKNKFSVKTV